MSILITGGTGFIGAQVVQLLLEKNEQGIVVFDINPSTKLLEGVADQIEIVRGDLGNFSHVLNVVKTVRPKAIYHLGGMLSVPSDADHAASFRANAMGTFHILEAAKLFEVPQVFFSSTLATYGLDIQTPEIDDYTLQRPQLFYGCTKVFCEHMGLFYKRKYGLDFRGIRYPSIVGPGVKTPGVVQYTSWAIEESVKGSPYTIYVQPETRCPVMYFKDAAIAMVKVAEAPAENIQMVNYIIAGAKPIASAQELADIIRDRIPSAQIDFEPDLELQKVLDKLLLPIDDRIAREEWGWESQYDQERIVDDFIMEMKNHPERYE
ncbi:MAG: NAD-dependent epimerase/dehydratase family protein [Deltaproteobacteria bacterium]|nr:NAD-dependent epimerase/dehydratase family protein [Deltaproteobacteria bacterium]